MKRSRRPKLDDELVRRLKMLDDELARKQARLDDKSARRRERLDDESARKWLKKHPPKKAPKPNSKARRRERWQILRQKQTQERQALARPLLTSVEW